MILCTVKFQQLQMMLYDDISYDIMWPTYDVILLIYITSDRLSLIFP